MGNACRFELLLPAKQHAALKGAASARGFSSLNAFVRNVLQNELQHGETALDRTEQNIAASIDRLAREIRALHTAQQAAFALTDSLARLFLTCIPEPPREVLTHARRLARLRYQRFLKSVARNMTSDSRATITDLSDRA